MAVVSGGKISGGGLSAAISSVCRAAVTAAATSKAPISPAVSRGHFVAIRERLRAGAPVCKGGGRGEKGRTASSGKP